MGSENPASEYGYSSADATWDDRAIYLQVVRRLAQFAPGKQIFEIGCGNGQTARRLCDAGFQVCAIEHATSGVEQARMAAPTARIECGSAYDDLSAAYGQFDAVVSIEVIEHLYDPRTFARRVSELLRPGGIALISTPYHGFWKNLAVVLSGRYEHHHNPLWDHGHIKFFTPKSLQALFAEQQMPMLSLDRIGRIPVLAKSMLGVFRKS
jgi:2-polyprenyl-3-methyl-5-hydroxy-6-metoxy-1,4-benzoquinol methylase